MSFYLMHRGWMNNPALAAGREPFCRRAAWAWLIEEAAWSDRKADALGKTVMLRRGQLCHSYRFMAKAWKWSIAGVQRFIDRLKTDTMIDTASDTGCLVITICNYDTYQTTSALPDTAPDTPSDTHPVRGRYTSGTNEKEGNKGKEGKNLDSTSPVADEPPPAPSVSADLFGTAEVVRLPPDRCDEAATSWNAMAARCGLSAVRFPLSNGRRTALRLRLREGGGIDAWNDIMQQIADAPFLLGQNDRGWKADFDFVLQPKSFAKIREGAYANRGKPTAARGRLDDWSERFEQRYGNTHVIDGEIAG